MKMQSTLALAVALTSLSTMGCGAVFDLAYLAGNKRFDKSTEERRPTGQVQTAIEYESAVAPDGRIQISCEERERRIERTFNVSKVYEYRGSYESGTYIATTAMSAAAGGLLAGILGGICTLPPSPQQPDALKVSCWNMLYAAPFALDIGWSLIRMGTAKEPKLVDKQKTEGQIALSEVPSRVTSVTCDSIDRVMLGNAYGSSEADVLSGHSQSSSMTLTADAIPVAIDNGSITLASQPEVVHAWAKNSSLGLWVVNRERQPRSLKVDRCPALRPAFMIMTPAEMTLFNASCPLGPPTTPPR